MKIAKICEVEKCTVSVTMLDGFTLFKWEGLWRVGSIMKFLSLAVTGNIDHNIKNRNSTNAGKNYRWVQNV